VYTYRHILSVLHIKLRQMEGITLDSIGQELADMTGDVLERRVASALGPGLPTPDRLPLISNDRPAWGRAGRALRAWLSDNVTEEVDEEGTPDRSSMWRRLPVSRGIELHVQNNHPLAQMGDRDRDLADAVRLAVARIMGMAPEQPSPEDALEQPDTEAYPQS
jgi:hypothetical protein